MGSVNKVADELDISFALSPNDPESIPSLVQKISSLGGDYETHRLELVAKARALVCALETPQETMIQHLWSNGLTLAVIGSGVEVGLFRHLAKNDGSPERAVDIAATLGIEVSMLSRLLRHMAAMGYIVETGPDTYKPTRFSKSLSIPMISDGYPQQLDTIFPVMSIMPEYISNLGLKRPDEVEGIFQKAHRTDKSSFDYFYSNPRSVERFHRVMDGLQQGQARWYDPAFYPVQESLVDGADTGLDAVFLVDVGGSAGHDIARFHNEFPDVPGRLILQDLPEVIEAAKGLDPKIEPMANDFFIEQPIKGARMYYMHSILHDWSDDKCRDILVRMKDAMRPGYSKLLIHEIVVLSTGTSWQTTSLDIMMFLLNGSEERTEEAWRSLIEGAGLKICKIWSVENSRSSIIECEAV